MALSKARQNYPRSLQRLSHPAYFNEQVTQGAFSRFLRETKTHTYSLQPHTHTQINVAYSIRQTPLNWRLWRVGRRKHLRTERGRRAVTADVTVWGLRDGAALSCFCAVSGCQGDQPARVQHQDSQHVKGTRLAISSNQKVPKWREKQKDKQWVIRCPLQPGTQVFLLQLHRKEWRLKDRVKIAPCMNTAHLFQSVLQ